MKTGWHISYRHAHDGARERDAATRPEAFRFDATRAPIMWPVLRAMATRISRTTRTTCLKATAVTVAYVELRERFGTAVPDASSDMTPSTRAPKMRDIRPTPAPGQDWTDECDDATCLESSRSSSIGARNFASNARNSSALLRWVGYFFAALDRLAYLRA